MNANPLETLMEKRAGLDREIETMKAAVVAANRAEFTSEETEKLSGLINECERLDGQIDLYRKTETLRAAASQPMPRVTQPSTVSATPMPIPGATTITGGVAVSATYGNHGFGRGFSEYLGAVRASAYGKTDQRLLNAITTYGAEGIGPDGGFAVPPDFAAKITEVVTGEQSLVAKLNPILTSSNQVVLPTDETTPYGTAGIVAEWLSEASAMTARKPALKQTTINLYKVGALVYLSDELAADAPAIQSHVTRKVAAAIAGKVNEALITGNGVAKPLGFINCPAKVEQVKSGATLAAVDLGNMLSRMIPESLANAFWIMHSTFLPKVWTLTLGQMPIYVQDLRSSPFGTLLGRPIVVSEYCSDYNTAGDVFLVSPDGYACAIKSGGVETAASIHFAFDQGLQAFRATMRVGGTGTAQAAVARKNGTTTLSHIIDLGVRS